MKKFIILLALFVATSARADELATAAKDFVTTKRCIEVTDYAEKHKPISIDDHNYVAGLFATGFCVGTAYSVAVALMLPPDEAEICLPGRGTFDERLSGEAFTVALRYAKARPTKEQSTLWIWMVADALRAAWPCKQPRAKLDDKAKDGVAAAAARIGASVERCVSIMGTDGKIILPGPNSPGEREHVFDAGSCDGVVYTVFISLYDDKLICLPSDGVTREQLHAAAYGYAKRNPSRWRLPWSTVVNLALEAAWPCKK